MSERFSAAAAAGASRVGTGLPRTFDGNMQVIAAAVHRRGVNLIKSGDVVGSVEAPEICRTLRQAHERTRGTTPKKAATHAHVEQMAAAIANNIGARGAVEVSRHAWNLIRAYADPTTEFGT